MVATRVIVANILTLQASITALGFTSQVTTTNTGGGVVAIIANQIVMTSGTKIGADSAGFSGGLPATGASSCSDCAPVGGCRTTNYQCIQYRLGAERGASIAPYSENTAVRGNCRGSLANGGGGGNNHNSPGGGGANLCANSLALPWTGDGVGNINI